MKLKNLLIFVLIVILTFTMFALFQLSKKVKNLENKFTVFPVQVDSSDYNTVQKEIDLQEENRHSVLGTTLTEE